MKSFILNTPLETGLTKSEHLVIEENYPFNYVLKTTIGSHTCARIGNFKTDSFGFDLGYNKNITLKSITKMFTLIN